MLERTRKYDETRQYDDLIFEGRDEDTDDYRFTDRPPAPYQFALSVANVHSERFHAVSFQSARGP